MIDKLLTINHHVGRKMPIDLIVIHATEGDASSVISWFNNPVAVVSAHYFIEKDGTVIRFVKEEDEAWHAGRVDHPTSAIVLSRPGVNPNHYSIGIEHEASTTDRLTDAQRTSSLSLITDICERQNTPRNRKHIVGHHEIYSLKTCPDAINVDLLVAAL